MAERAITDEVEVRCGLGAGALLVLTAVLVTAEPTVGDGVALFLAATVLLSHLLDAPRALLLGLTGWALATGFVVKCEPNEGGRTVTFANGFVINTAGDLTLAPWDLVRLAVFLLAAAGVAGRGPWT